MCIHLLNNRTNKSALLYGVGLLLLSLVGNAQQKWEGLETGFDWLVSINDLTVDSLEDKLVLGSAYLNSVNGVSTCSVLKWSPENGTEILSPKDFSIMPVENVQKIIFSNDSMIVVGDFGIGIYKNGQWIHKLSDENGSIRDIIPYKGKYLIAIGYGGWFLGFLDAPQVLLWDGDTTFTEFENITNYLSPGGGVFGLANYQNNVIMAGNVRLFQGGIMDNIMSWNGSNWDDMDGGIHNTVGLGGVTVLQDYQGDLYIGGMFYQNNHSKENLIARWDGQKWKSVGGGFGWGYGAGSEIINAMHVHDGYLYVSGAFQLAGGTPANSIARWDGNEWCGCGSTFDGQVLAMAHYRDTLYVAGGFNHIDGDSITKVARFIGDNFADTCGSLAVAIQSLLPEPIFLEGFPNPAINTFIINLPLSKTETVKLVVYNNMGQVVIPSQRYTTNSKISFDVSTLSKGAYIGRLMSEDEMFIVKFVKE